jgi:hypothetical protein
LQRNGRWSRRSLTISSLREFPVLVEYRPRLPNPSSNSAQTTFDD